MHRSARAAALILLPLALLSACSTFQGRDDSTQTTRDEAQQLSAQGRYDDAAQRYLQLAANSHPASPYRLDAAEAYRQGGEWSQLAALLPQVHPNNLDRDGYAHWILLRAELDLQRQQLTPAQELLNQPDLDVSSQWRPRLWELRSQLLATQGDNWQAARYRQQLDNTLREPEQSRNRSQLLALLSALGSSELKQRAAAMPADDPMYRWTLQALQQQGLTAPPPAGQQVGTLLPDSDANVREGYQMPRQVALLLPTNGPAAHAASIIREGFFAAYAAAAGNHAPRAKVKVYDSGSTTASVLSAYKQALTDGAQFVVGPLLRDQVGALLAQPWHTPMLALNYPSAQTPPSDHVGEFGLQPETEGQQAADQMLAQGLRQAYVIISSDDFAQRAASAFKSAFAAKGGLVGGMATLPAAGVNYLALIRGMGMPTVSYNTNKPSAAAANGPDGGLQPPPAPTAGVFISMRPEPARLLLPQLHLARIQLPVYATSHIYAGSDDAGDDGDLDGVNFCDAPWLFDAQAGLPRRDDLTVSLPATQGANARLFAFGMDAWALLPYLDWMRAHPGSYLPGASGQLSADGFGRISRNLIWARFDNGLAHPASDLELELDPAAASTAAPAAASSSL